MSVNVGGDDVLVPTSDSFWEVDGYRRTVKRVEDGLQQCGELMKLIQERAEIEKEYAKRLKTWSKKWNEIFDRGPEYGTNKCTWKGIFDEADHLADIHLDIKDRLLNEVQAQIKDWKNEHYKKQMVGGCKEAKNFEEEFRKAQKPWSKRLEKVIKCKKDYHLACKLERTASNQENNAKNSSEFSPDQVKKLQEKVEKYRKEVEATRERYKQSLVELNSYNAKYVEDMTEVFQRTQDFEHQRLVFCKKILYDLHSRLDLTQIKALPEIYSQFRETINQSDAVRDLKWWSQFHGVDMAMAWPTFEEYSPDLHSISSRDKARGVVAVDNSIRLTSVQASSAASSPTAPPSYYSASSAQATPSETSPSVIYSNTELDQDDEWSNQYENFSGKQGTPSSGRTAAAAAVAASKASQPAASSVAGDGVPVRAIFDYQGQEDDELSFRAGDVFHKIKDRDDQGWCTGRKNGRIGLYPDNYVELL